MTRHAVKVHLRERKRKAGTVFFLDYYDKGERKQESLSICIHGDDTRDSAREKRELAQLIRARRESELLHHREGLPSPAERQALIVDALTEVMSGTRHHREAIRWFERYCETIPFPVTIGNCTPAVLEGFERYLTSQGLAQNTRRTTQVVVKSLLKSLSDKSLFDYDIVRRWSLPKLTDVETRYLTEDELSRLAATECDRPVVKLAFLFSVCTGLRLSDIERLSWESIRGDQITLTMRKTRGLVYVPLNEDAKVVLSIMSRGTHSTGTGRVFDLPKGRTTTWHTLQQWANNAGVQPFSFHCGRHSAATRLLNAGADITTVQAILGHRSLTMSLRYAKVTAKTSRTAVDRVPRLLLNEGGAS